MKRPLYDLAQFVPSASVEYCRKLHHDYNFQLIITPPRRTRLGCFSVRPPHQPVIRMNQDLNQYSFLITYLHEVAHCIVYLTYKKKRVAPHGQEWKQSFRTLLIPVLSEQFFPTEVLYWLGRYALNPKASTAGAPQLYQALKLFDEVTVDDTAKIPLMHVKEGMDFVFQTRVFIKGALRRTRVMCVEKSSKRRYTIPAHALVEEYRQQ